MKHCRYPVMHSWSITNIEAVIYPNEVLGENISRKTNSFQIRTPRCCKYSLKLTLLFEYSCFRQVLITKWSLPLSLSVYLSVYTCINWKKKLVRQPVWGYFISRGLRNVFLYIHICIFVGLFFVFVFAVAFCVHACVSMCVSYNPIKCE